MAQGQIQKSDLVQDNVLAEFNKELQQTIANVNLLKTAITATAEAGKQIKKGIGGAPKPKDVASMKEFNKLNKTAEQNAKNRVKLGNQLVQAQDKEVKAKLRYKKATQDQAKALKLEVELEQAEIGSLKRLRLEQKKLREEKDRINITTKAGQRQMKEVNRTMNKNNKILDQNATKLGKLKNNIGNYKSALGGLRNVLGQLGLAFGVFTLIRDSFNVVKDFEQAQANLASVLGVTTDQMTALTDQAKELGATTTFTASEVLSLQKELAKLGFTSQQIQAMTEATLLLAEATGTDLARAAEVTGATIRGFGLAAEDTQRVVDVMAKSFSSSSLDMEKFATGMATVAPIAKQMGFSLEDTTALLGVLTDRGIDASTAGTGLRNMFLNASKEGMTLTEALDQVNNASDKTGASFDLFGKRGATLGVILAENRDSIDKLTGELLDADGAAKKMADTQRKTLGGALKLLKSAWEGMILKMNEAGGAGDKLRRVVVYLADNLDSILSTLWTVVEVFIAYKTQLLAVKFIQSNFITDLGKFGRSLMNVKGGAKGAAGAFKNMGGALKSVGWAAVIYGAIQLAKAFWKAATGARQLRMEAHQMQVQMQGAEESGNKNLDALRKKQQEKIEDIQDERKLKNITAEEELKQIAAVKKATSNQLESYIKTVTKRRSQMQRLYMPMKRQLDMIERTGRGQLTQISSDLAEALGVPAGWLPKSKQDYLELSKAVATYKGKIEGTQVKLDLYKNALHEQNREIKFAKTDVEALGMETDGFTGSIEDNTDAIDDNVSSLDDFIKKWQEPTMPGDQLKLPLVDVDPEDVLGEFERELDKTLKDKELKLLKSGKTEEEIARALLKEKLKLIQKEIDFKQSLGVGMTEEQKLKAGVSTIDLEIEEQNIMRDLKKKNQEELFEITKSAIDLSTQYFLDQADKRIEKIDEEISAAEKQADIYRELAMNGNITAKESLAEQNRLIAEANREKAEEERKKQLIEKGSAILLAFNAALEGGDKPGEAFLKAITTVAGLDLFINALSFMGGTEDTGHTGSGVDGKGGFHAVLHPKEGVLKREHNEKKLQAGLTNETMLNSALKYQNLLDQRTIGSHIDVNTQLGNGWDSHLIVNNLMKVGDKLDTVTKAINDKPVYKSELGKSMSKMMEIKETIEKGNRKTTNTFVVKQ